MPKRQKKKAVPADPSPLSKSLRMPARLQAAVLTYCSVLDLARLGGTCRYATLSC
jgi:hypothetical protein